ncbi:putative soyasaponin III rhamnosyltransferase [Medicago truncatula]|uniref:Putative soyasaponin III rhamnosyltransferase n=1 Tax=Medicago truncatula TaxID=3880 RepID=G7JCX2_MEDTR|nr:UDP-glycosyltransferase, putative [Medicago truncatula]AES91504.1 UDP-glycosyltransferase, putative [Medicago truncatula]RHN63939.1 putative soyasaponin III rhamnosyltransferase [Medicago truncatula]
MDIPLNMNKFLELAYLLKDDIIEILKTSKPDWVFYDYGTVWLAPIAKSLNIASVHYSITPACNICIQNYSIIWRR